MNGEAPVDMLKKLGRQVVAMAIADRVPVDQVYIFYARELVDQLLLGGWIETDIYADPAGHIYGQWPVKRFRLSAEGWRLIGGHEAMESMMRLEVR